RSESPCASLLLRQPRSIRRTERLFFLLPRASLWTDADKDQKLPSTTPRLTHESSGESRAGSRVLKIDIEDGGPKGREQASARVGGRLQQRRHRRAPGTSSPVWRSSRCLP